MMSKLAAFCFILLFYWAECSNTSCKFPPGTCQCYSELEESLLATEENKFKLSTTFFPLENNQPEFVIVIYKFDNTSASSQVWFWSAYTSHFLHPFEVFQFSSLFFGKPEPYYRSRNSLHITLKSECGSLPLKDMNLQLLTQRLKYYAERGTSNLILHDAYSAKAYSNETFKELVMKDSHRTTNIIICTTVFVFVLSLTIILCVACSSICTKSHRNSKLLEKLKRNKSAVLSLAVLSFIANIYIIFLAGTAVGYWQHRGERELRELFHGNVDSKFELTNSIPLGFALTFDLLCLILWLIIVAISVFVYFKADHPDDYNIPILALTVLCPILCVIAHSPYIAIAYLDDGSHASSIFIYYSILGYILFGLLWLFFHWCENFEKDITKLRTITLVILSFVIFIFLGLVVTITCYFVLIPINKSISDAPNRVFGIYQSGGFVIGSFIIYKLFESFHIKKKKDTVTVEHIHKLLKERLPHPLLQQLQQQYDRLLQLELHSLTTGQNPQEQLKCLLYKHQQDVLHQTKQQLLQQPQDSVSPDHDQPQTQQQNDLHDLQEQLYKLQHEYYEKLFLPPQSESVDNLSNSG